MSPAKYILFLHFVLLYVHPSFHAFFTSAGINQKLPPAKEAQYKQLTQGKVLSNAGVKPEASWTQVNVFDIIDETRKEEERLKNQPKDGGSDSDGKRGVKFGGVQSQTIQENAGVQSLPIQSLSLIHI